MKLKYGVWTIIVIGKKIIIKEKLELERTKLRYGNNCFMLVIISLCRGTIGMLM